MPSVSVTKCAAGYKFVPKNGANATKCEACPEGTFNDKDDASTTCVTHNACADSSVKVKGTASKDAVCKPGMWIPSVSSHQLP